MIRFSAEDIKMPKLNKKLLSLWIKKVALLHGKNVGEIGYIFSSDDYILQTNKQFLNHDYYTDVITFDYSKGNTISGDIVISIDTIESNAALFKQNFADELDRIIIHGVLHLCGFKDKNPQDKAVMTQMENQALELKKQLINEF